MQSPLAIRPLSRTEVREVDRRAFEEYGMSGLVLMENAGRGCADLIEELGYGNSVAICCGKGNNAGDGFVIARHLDARGIEVHVLLFADPAEFKGEAAANFEILRRSNGAYLCEHWRGFDSKRVMEDLLVPHLVVDALLGTGSSGAPRPPLDAAIRLLNEYPSAKLAIDLPSGLDCDTGQPAEPTFRADHTCTFVAPKIGFGNPAAQPFLGQVHVVGIGVPRKLLEEVNACGQ